MTAVVEVGDEILQMSHLSLCEKEVYLEVVQSKDPEKQRCCPPQQTDYVFVALPTVGSEWMILICISLRSGSVA